MAYFFSGLHDVIVKKHDVNVSYIQSSPILNKKTYNVSMKEVDIAYHFAYYG
jgi:hypothetical protein